MNRPSAILRWAAPPITDTLEAQARYDQTGAQEIAAKNDLEVKRSALQQLINSIPGDLDHLGKGFKLEATATCRHGKVGGAGAAKQSASWLSRRQAPRSPTRKWRAIAAGHYPTVDLVANYSKSDANGSIYDVGIDSTNKSIGVQLNMPLFEGGAVNSRLREAEANRERARQELENARRSAEQQTRQAYLGVVSGIAQVQALQQALASSQSVLDASKLGQQVGVRTNLDVLNAQQAALFHPP